MRDGSDAVNKHKLLNGEAEEDKGRIRVSLVSAEDEPLQWEVWQQQAPLPVSHRSLSLRKGLRIALVLLLLVFFFLFFLKAFLLPRGTHFTIILVPYRLSLGVTFLHFLILLTAVVI